MKLLNPPTGPLLGYLHMLPEPERKNVTASIEALLSTPEGAMLLEALENSTLKRAIPILQDPRALDALNAQALVFHDLNRIARGSDAYLATDTTPVPRNPERGGRRER